MFGLLPLSAQEEQGPPYPAVIEPALDIEGWGQGVDPEGDCKIEGKDGKLSIQVPASPQPRDLAAEIKRVNAPRVMSVVNGDFIFQVKVEGNFVPGGDSNQPGRTGYNGGAIILMSDTDHVVTLARAALQVRGGEPRPYANFEMRSGGLLDRIGNTGDKALPLEGPVWLRMERKGREILASVSEDGTEWFALPSRILPDNWPYQLHVGVAAITTSKDEFTPVFSELKRN